MPQDSCENYQNITNNKWSMVYFSSKKKKKKKKTAHKKMKKT